MSLKVLPKPDPDETGAEDEHVDDGVVELAAVPESEADDRVELAAVPALKPKPFALVQSLPFDDELPGTQRLPFGEPLAEPAALTEAESASEPDPELEPEPEPEPQFLAEAIDLAEASDQPEAGELPASAPATGFYKDGQPEDLEAGQPGGSSWVELIGDGEEVSGDRGLGLLVDLVREGTVDPWDVDLEVVADRFMAAVDSMTAEDLPRSGRLFFFASVIIRMKAQFLAGHTADLLAEPAFGEEEGWGDDGEIDYGLEGDEEGDVLRHRRGPGEILLFPKSWIQKRRAITIQDLLEALESSEKHEQKMAEQRERRANKPKVKLPFKNVKEAMDTLHQDDLTGDIRTAARLVQLAFLSLAEVPLTDLTKELDRVSAFLALLFLAARGEVDLIQDSFYGPVRIARPPEDRDTSRVVPRERFVPKKKPKKVKVKAPVEAEGEDGDDASGEAEKPAGEGPPAQLALFTDSAPSASPTGPAKITPQPEEDDR